MSDATNAPYPHVGKADLPGIERRILEYWAANHTFEASVEQRPVDTEYVFYDGPPFANGLPHHGHLLTGYVKDVVPRYFTMKGQRVERRFGWDCHGLPAEMEAEKELPVAGRASIIEYGNREVQRVLPDLGTEIHQGVGEDRHPASPLG